MAFKRTFGGLRVEHITITDLNRRAQAIQRIQILHPFWTKVRAEAELALHPEYLTSETYTGPRERRMV